MDPRPRRAMASAQAPQRHVLGELHPLRARDLPRSAHWARALPQPLLRTQRRRAQGRAAVAAAGGEFYPRRRRDRDRLLDDDRRRRRLAHAVQVWRAKLPPVDRAPRAVAAEPAACLPATGDGTGIHPPHLLPRPRRQRRRDPPTEPIGRANSQERGSREAPGCRVPGWRGTRSFAAPAAPSAQADTEAKALGARLDRWPAGADATKPASRASSASPQRRRGNKACELDNRTRQGSLLLPELPVGLRIRPRGAARVRRGLASSTARGPRGSGTPLPGPQGSGVKVPIWVGPVAA